MTVAATMRPTSTSTQVACGSFAAISAAVISILSAIGSMTLPNVVIDLRRRAM
jgi:hypothetical protein